MSTSRNSKDQATLTCSKLHADCCPLGIGGMAVVDFGTPPYKLTRTNPIAPFLFFRTKFLLSSRKCVCSTVSIRGTSIYGARTPSCGPSPYNADRVLCEAVRDTILQHVGTVLPVRHPFLTTHQSERMECFPVRRAQATKIRNVNDESGVHIRVPTCIMARVPGPPGSDQGLSVPIVSFPH